MGVRPVRGAWAWAMSGGHGRWGMGVAGMWAVLWAGPGPWAGWGLGCVLGSGLGCEHGLWVWYMSESLGCRQSGGRYIGNSTNQPLLVYG